MWWTAFLIGLAGSAHCVGMCGPLALALPGRNRGRLSIWLGSTLYNIGRILTYMLIGAIFGFAGRKLYFAGLQKWTAIIAGIVMILMVLLPMLFSRAGAWNGIFTRGANTLIGRFRKLFKSGNKASLIGIGLLNGLLPCGLVYVAVAGAIHTKSVGEGAIYMLAFGLGTFPMMMAVSLAGSMISLRMRAFVNKIAPYVVMLLGVLFIVRGLALGIPYLSPKSSALVPDVKKARECCRPK